MATPADQRLIELLDKWLSSLELHLKYSSLDDDTYWKMQPWVEHQRPNRWIIDLARQKTLALRKEVQKRIDAADTGFADSLELMTFLANLVGSQHIERFIPLADPETERWVSSAAAKMHPPAAEATREMPGVSPSAGAGATGTMDMLRPEKAAIAATATREMPRFVAPGPQSPPPVTTEQVTRLERKAREAVPPADKYSPPKSGAKSSAKSSSKTAARSSGRASSEMPLELPEEATETVIADAVRLVQWGRKWYELAELISRMADRPGLPDVRRILKDRRSEIEKLAGR